MARCHPEEHKEMEENEKSKSTVKAKAVKRKNADGASDQTLSSCLNRRLVTWPSTSKEHQQRLNSVMNMIITTGMHVSDVT